VRSARSPAAPAGPWRSTIAAVVDPPARVDRQRNPLHLV
jgi:hypothetical protein